MSKHQEILLSHDDQRTSAGLPDQLTGSDFNPLIATLKPQSNGPSYRKTVIGTLAVDWWVVTFGTAMRELGGGDWAGPHPAQSPPRCAKCNSPPINGRCTNFVLFDVALYLPLESKG